MKTATWVWGRGGRLRYGAVFFNCDLSFKKYSLCLDPAQPSVAIHMHTSLNKNVIVFSLCVMYSMACSMLLKNVGCDPLSVSCTPLMDYDQFKKHLSKAFWTEGEACKVTH